VNYQLAVDLGGTNIKLGLLRTGAVVDEQTIPANSISGLSANLASLEKNINDLLAKNNVRNNLSGIGFAFPGLVDPVRKKVLSTNKKYDDAPAFDIEKWVKDRWNTEFFIDNDARMAAVGEWKFGAAKGSDDVVVITIGTGIGSSAIIEGKLLRGKHFQAGCLGGHFTVNYRGNICTCGNIGCVEAEASTRSIASRITTDPDYHKSTLSKVDTIDFLSVFTESKNNDDLATVVKYECMDVWSAGLINLIHAYDPEIVVLGGGILNSKDEVIPYIAERVNKYAWCPWGRVKIVSSDLMNRAALLGVGYCLEHKI
jgi:glucokinase